VSRTEGSAAREGERSVVVAMAAARVVQVAFDEIVDVVAVGHRIVTTVGTMRMGRVVTGTDMTRLAPGRVGVVDRDDVLVDVIAVRVVQVTVVQVVDVVPMPHGRVAAVGAVNVGVALVCLAVRHGALSFLRQSVRCSWSSSAWSSAFEISSTTCWSASV
jgi:hypothetical protein